VLREIPREKYTETFIDVGQADMLSVLRVLKEVGYDRLLHPDHAPVFPGDENREAGWGYAIGFMKGLMKAL
jgi:mannonate dehydratase